MDTTPVYDLRERLRAVAIAGTNLLSEDFRLKRAYEAFRSLESASSVFVKAGQLTAQLLSSDCLNPQGILLDTLSLLDAVVCTLGTVEVKGELEQPDMLGTGQTAVSRIVNAPCSKVKALIDALTTSGSGNYSIVCDLHVSDPEIFADYRVRYAMVQALGASYAELAEMVKNWLADEGESIMPLLKKGFDPKGKKGMVRRVQLIEALAGAAENDFYIEMLKTATGEVRTALIEALRHEPSNIEVLLNMEKTEKGKNKQTVLKMLAFVEDDRCYELFHAMAAKKSTDACEYLFATTTDWASSVIAELCTRQLSDLVKLPQSEWKSAKTEKKMEQFCQTVTSLIGKHGDSICACYRELLLHTDILEMVSKRIPFSELLCFSWETTRTMVYYGDKIKLNGLGEYHFPVRSRKLSWSLAIGSLMAQSLMVYADDNLVKLALELYENSAAKPKDINFLMASTVAKILGPEDCTGWLDANAVGQAELDEMERAFVCFCWDRKLKSYVVDMECGHISDHVVPHANIFHKVQIPHAKEIADWMMRHRGKSTDAILNRWVDTTDAAECAKYGKYFYERASSIVDNEEYLRYMRNCGWKQCKGLGTDYAKIKVRPDDYWRLDEYHYWRLDEYLRNMPGDAQTLLEETSAVVELVRTGQVELSHLDDPEKIENWAAHLKDLTIYNALRDER